MQEIFTELLTNKYTEPSIHVDASGLDNNVCPGQVKFVCHLSVGTSKKKTHTEIP
jgi:hypothetical protein